MEIVAGLNFKCLEPKVWREESNYYLPDLKAVMISYAEFYRMPKNRRLAMEQGIRDFLVVPKNVKVYLDNGAFYFTSRDGKVPIKDYEEFVKNAKPDWYPIPQDFIPTPKMSLEEQESCLHRTMSMNLNYQHRKNYIPVIHVSQVLDDYIDRLKEHPKFCKKTHIALGGIVANLLRSPKAMSHTKILKSLQQVRQEFSSQKLHVFGIGGTSTLHIAALLGIDSVDSSGWRNRAARGLIQLPGKGDRTIADLGSWKCRELSDEELKQLKECQCPACQRYSIEGLKTRGQIGFSNRATHNLWVLLEESKQIEKHLKQGNYQNWYQQHIDNIIYRPLIEKIITDDISNNILR